MQHMSQQHRAAVGQTAGAHTIAQESDKCIHVLLCLEHCTYPLAKSMHDASKLLPDSFLEVARLREMVQGSYMSQHRQELDRLLWHDFSELTQKVDCAV